MREKEFIEFSLENKIKECQEIAKKESLHDISKFLLQLCVLTAMYVNQKLKKRIDEIKLENEGLQKQIDDLKIGKGWANENYCNSRGKCS